MFAAHINTDNTTPYMVQIICSTIYIENITFHNIIWLLLKMCMLKNIATLCLVHTRSENERTYTKKALCRKYISQRVQCNRKRFSQILMCSVCAYHIQFIYLQIYRVISICITSSNERLRSIYTCFSIRNSQTTTK